MNKTIYSIINNEVVKITYTSDDLTYFMLGDAYTKDENSTDLHKEITSEFGEMDQEKTVMDAVFSDILKNKIAQVKSEIKKV